MLSTRLIWVKGLVPSVTVLGGKANGNGLNKQDVRNYAKAPMGGIPSLGKKPSKLRGGPVVEKKKLPVETDAGKLVNYLCGSNIMQKGEDVKLKEDSEYPEWLWKLNTGNPPPLEELDPDTDYYWIRVRKIAMRRSLAMMKLRKV